MLAFARAAALFYPVVDDEPGIDARAVIDASARIGADCRIAAGVVVGRAVEIGRQCRIEANAVIGEGVVIGDGSHIGANASLSHCLIGQRANIHPGVRIGQRGFGFAMETSGHVDIPQLGRVIVEDDVEIGANSTIDRGSGPDTFIGAGSKIDNLVQIGHNVRIGRGCVLVGLVGIAGSVELGDHVVVAGQAGIAGHLRIGAGAQIGAQAGVVRDVPAGERVVGSPAEPLLAVFKQMSVLRGLVARADRKVERDDAPRSEDEGQ
jgi:UDP-3-O-[3-hydroxymyristoyl] glucosamine N-acyltransferase